MLDWLQSIGQFLINIGEFVVAFFRNVIELCILIFKGFSFALLAINYMPVQYAAVLIAILSFSVIVTIVHFGG